MRRIFAMLVLSSAMMGAVGCHTCDVCDDCGCNGCNDCSNQHYGVYYQHSGCANGTCQSGWAVNPQQTALSPSDLAKSQPKAVPTTQVARQVKPTSTVR